MLSQVIVTLVVARVELLLHLNALALEPHCLTSKTVVLLFLFGAALETAVTFITLPLASRVKVTLISASLRRVTCLAGFLKLWRVEDKGTIEL